MNLAKYSLDNTKIIYFLSCSIDNSGESLPSVS